MQRRTGIVLLTALFALPASSVLAKPGRGQGQGNAHAKHADRDRDRNRDHHDGDSGQALQRGGLDRNGDGVITRAEWRGNDHSFRVQDRNRDGVITASDRSEWRGSAGARSGANARYGDWRSLDRDRDGVLTRGEWPHGSTLFEDLDRNHDGVVSQWELRRSSR